MTRKLDLPDTPQPGPDAAMSAPSAMRNRDAIVEILARVAPSDGRALELASGTGEHVIVFAPATPSLTWQPTDADPLRLASIASWMTQFPSTNLLPPKALDACAPGWAADHGPVELIMLVNLLHLISNNEAAILLNEIAKALAPGGIALLYGPFLRDGEPTSTGDASFHASLQAQDPAVGYKDIIDVSATLASHGLRIFETVKMPANNLMICAELPA